MADTNRPLGQLDNNYRLDPDSFNEEAFQGEYDGNDNLIYKGSAKPGSATDLPVWQISFFTYDGNNNLLSVTWPQNSNGVASSNFDFVWDDRATYTFS
jgi:YD repeat-containing protein